MPAITTDDDWMDARLLPDLLVLREVARTGSLTRAATHLHTVQSNVTARIQKLEEAAGTPLLKRHARGVRLTPAGEAAMALAMRLGAVLDDLRFTFDRPVQKRATPLRIGAIETVLAAHLPPLVARFLQQHPQVDVSVRTGSSAALLQQLKAGELDAVYVSRVPETPLRSRPALRDELVVVAPPAEDRKKPWEVNGPMLNVLVQRHGCSYTERLLKFLAAKSRRPYRMLELGTLEGILGFVETGLGVTAMPRAFVAIAGRQRRITLHALPREIRDLQTHLVIPSATEASFATEAFFKAT